MCADADRPAGRAQNFQIFLNRAVLARFEKLIRQRAVVIDRGRLISHGLPDVPLKGAELRSGLRNPQRHMPLVSQLAENAENMSVRAHLYRIDAALQGVNDGFFNIVRGIIVHHRVVQLP